MINLIITVGEEKHNGELPESWEDVTLKQLNDIDIKSTLPIEVELVRAFTGLPVEVILNAGPELSPVITEALAFFTDRPNWEELPHPKEIDGLKIPDPIRETWGQKVLAMQPQPDSTQIEVAARVIAIYLQPIISGGNFDYNEALELLPRVMGFRVVEALPLANFFLSRSLNLPINGGTDLKPSTTTRKRSKTSKKPAGTS